jgi:guanine deaminase
MAESLADGAERAARWLARAVDLAVKNARSGGGGTFGAVIVCGDQIVAEGVNRVTTENDPTAHAEVVAIREAAQKLRQFALPGCEIFTSCEPCPMCFGAILWARLGAVWYAASQEEAAEAGFDDSEFYRQIALSPGYRSVPMRRELARRAKEPFAAWAENQNKVSY